MMPLLQVFAAGAHDIDSPGLAVRGQVNDLSPYRYEAAASVASASPYVFFVPLAQIFALLGACRRLGLSSRRPIQIKWPFPNGR
jgi:hypothetical protein